MKANVDRDSVYSIVKCPSCFIHRDCTNGQGTLGYSILKIFTDAGKLGFEGNVMAKDEAWRASTLDGRVRGHEHAICQNPKYTVPLVLY